MGCARTDELRDMHVCYPEPASAKCAHLLETPGEAEEINQEASSGMEQASRSVVGVQSNHGLLPTKQWYEYDRL